MNISDLQRLPVEAADLASNEAGTTGFLILSDIVGCPPTTTATVTQQASDE